jgi:hypothetical protein
MKNFKWFLLIPCACLIPKVVNWCIQAPTRSERTTRVLWIFGNLYWTIIVLCFIIFNILIHFKLMEVK